MIDFGDAPVFTAIAYPSIIVTVKSSNLPNQVRALAWEMDKPIETFVEVFQAKSFYMPQNEFTSSGWRIESNDVLRLMDYLRSVGKSLSDYVDGRLYSGIKTGSNEAFVINRNTYDQVIFEDPSSTEILKPFLRGRDMKRWRIEYPDLYLCYIGWNLDIERYPAVYRHISRFRKELEARSEVKEGRVPWYALSRYAAEFRADFEQPKIMYQVFATYQAFAWVES